MAVTANRWLYMLLPPRWTVNRYLISSALPALTKEQWAEIQTKVTKGGANIIALRGRSSFQSPAYVSIEMIAAAMGGKPFRWPAGTYVHNHGFDHIMMAMET